MSYNINSTKELLLDASMAPEDVIALLDRSDDMPECTFLHDMEKAAKKALTERCACPHCGGHSRIGARFCSDCGQPMPASEPARIPLPNLRWYGEGSGHTFDFFKTEVAPRIRGRAHAIFVWEGGDSFTGIAIRDGEIAECKVVQYDRAPGGVVVAMTDGSQ